MTHSHLRIPAVIATLVAALLALVLAPAAASAAKPQARQSLYPAVMKVSPMTAGIGDRLVVTGKNFRKGSMKNTVVFKRDGKRAIFVRATGTSTTRISVKVPTKLLPYLGRRKGTPVMTRFRVRVLAKRFGKKYTSVRSSPRIGPATGPTKVALDDVDPDTDGDGMPDRIDPDDDNDLIADTDESGKYTTNPLARDTDGDGVIDSFEILSALDLNSSALPYPGKRRYPNALDKEDADTDHDGDGLTLRHEQRAWVVSGATLPLTYSDGRQWTGGGPVSDDMKDVDGDGLTNFSEVNGPLSGPDWWDRYAKDLRNRTPGCDPDLYVETPYPAPLYEGLDFADKDSDGDGVDDGNDDLDHDGFSNLREQARSEVPGAHWCDTYVSVGGLDGDPGHNWNGTATFAEFGATPDPLARVHPFNPCKPVYSVACHLRPPLGHYKETQPTDTAPGYMEDWASPVRP